MGGCLQEQYAAGINKKRMFSGSEKQIIIPEQAHLLVAKGACLDAKDTNPISVEKLKSKIQVLKFSKDTTTQPLQPLFKTNAEYEE